MTDTTRRAMALGALGLLAAPQRAGAAATRAREEAYGDHPRQRLDVHEYPGGRNGLSPMLLFVHGGGWNFGDKRAVNALPEYADRHGFILASTNYRLTPEVTARECAEDVAAAAAWMLQNGSRFGGDPRRLFIMGHSAGAHLVALVGVDPVYLERHGREPADLAGVIPIDGAGYDAVKQMARAPYPGRLGERLDGMYEMAFGADPEGLSPTRRVKRGGRYPPFQIFHVERRADAAEQSRGLAEALREAGGRAEVVAAPGETHRSINVGFGRDGDPEGERAARFIRTGQL